MSYTKIWVHCVWGTKSRYPFLKGDVKNRVISHILQKAQERNLHIECINGYDEHLHCLLMLPPDVSITKVMQQIKGESSFWINSNGVTKMKFEWACEYFATSVSESMLDPVKRYIFNQEAHHQKQTWNDEYELLMKYCLPAQNG